MPSFRRGHVGRIIQERAGLQRVEVHRDADSEGDGEPAYVLTQLTGPVAPGDEVLYNDTAVQLGLGTGGWHVVHANLTRSEWGEPGGGHVLKLRYTSLQADTGVQEERTPGVPTDLGGMPVVACTLHSQLGVVVAAARAVKPSVRIAYVMTDGGALPLALSDLVAELSARRLLVGTVSAGQAFGGDVEAVGVPSALALARHHLDADVAVVAMGPGVVGTESELGTSALEAGPVLDTAAALGGRPVLCVRASGVDARPRHRGVSHHALTVLDLVRSPVDVPVPQALVDLLDGHAARHHVVGVEAADAATSLEAAGLSVTTMGRGPADDPVFFAAAASAGAHAVALLRS
ncbi:MAG TPA: DUF3866 family protein [Acidimicrobiales bacterium]|jgi:hypothetical protein